MQRRREEEERARRPPTPPPAEEAADITESHIHDSAARSAVVSAGILSIYYHTLYIFINILLTCPITQNQSGPDHTKPVSIGEWCAQRQ